ncbi:aspartyl aminopeptidase [Sporothrix brasiliensis 5110]|uniref:aspartyl aminopeptidase n=1 Tax=Sporothrix brasiliensis 5110 TaxID=1398154 RepID=A0A0C2F1W4_9PEZI|nr:aspartyl aminopeptidase [Sporothrix brasiliensis 5110]KIH92934.1 aspartyl aminopeptidase [Sporothrix brasiliensis 5110]
MAPPKSAYEFIDFVNESPTPYHAVASAVARLEKAGFRAVKERHDWSSTLKPGGKYYVTRNGSSIAAFAIGGKWRPGNPVAMIGAHTDSPCLRLKPISRKSNVGFLQVGVEAYGGGIWHSWFDRDLSVAGRILVRSSDGNIVQKLIKVERPILRIPTLAIHLDRSPEFNPNKETELFPIAGLVSAELNKPAADAASFVTDSDDSASTTAAATAPLQPMTERHHPVLIDIIAKEAGVTADDVADFELVLYDTQKSCLGGLHEEFIFSPRLDNLGMTYCSVMGLIDSVAPAGSLDDESAIRLISCFDHEEVGSQSAQGANSDMLPAILRRLSVVPAASSASSQPASATAFEQTCSTSFLVSADMAHSVHPNYAGKYESNHHPLINKGTVIKINANQRYVTNSPGIVLLQETARAAGVPLQLFVVRNDSSCGSTIGPMLSAKMGVRTLDLGNPQLSMHSIRETGGAYDVEHGIKLFSTFFDRYSALEGKILVD